MNAFAVAFRTSAKRVLHNRAMLATRLGLYLLILGVLSALWKAATEAGPVAGYDYRAMLWYITIAEASVMPIDPRLIENIGFEIGSGAITVEMLRPASIVSLRLASTLGEALVRFGLCLFFGGTFAWLQVGPPPDAGAALIALPAAGLALACNLTAQHAFAAMAFWTHDSKAAWFLYQKCVFLVGGMLLPLELMPHSLQTAAWFMPFWTMSYAPARLASGHFEPLLLIGQAVWGAAVLGLAAAVFASGQRKLEVAGG